jgi:outer membrane protein assembly factor BamC
MRRREAGRYVACLLAGVALGACSSLPSLEKKVDYKSASQLPPLEVPPDLTRPSGDERYRVPDVNPPSTATYSDYSRERTARRSDTGASAVLPNVEKARIMRDGSQRWLIVRQPAERVWPLVKEFWQEAGFAVNRELPESGVMETDWLESHARVNAGTIRNFLSRMLDTVYSSGELDKFRTRLERGAEPGTTEIYISHRGMEEVYTSASSADRPETRWQPRSPDPNLEAEMLGRLMVRFGVDEPQVKSQLAAAPAALPRATLSKGGNGAGMLALHDQFDRAWRRVGLALDRVGFTVEDRDRSKGLYYVRYMDPQADGKGGDKGGGFLSWLKFWGSSEKPKPEQYRIQVKDVNSDGCEINVLAKDGTRETSETAGRILSLLYEQLK